MASVSNQPTPWRNGPYSDELERACTSLDWCCDDAYDSLDRELVLEIERLDRSLNCRGGRAKASFNYIFLDPRITDNLPVRARADNMEKLTIWTKFLSAIFYVGKGTNSRPYQHLNDAAKRWKNKESTSDNAMLNRILDIWRSNRGVICLRVFQRVSSVEAHTREAAIIAAIGLRNLTNKISGTFYGSMSDWSDKRKQMLGVHLLYRAMQIFLSGKERELHACDITFRN